MQITQDIPDDIATTVQDNLPQILAIGLREMNANPNNGFSGLTEILHFLAQLPSPQEVLNLHLAPAAQQEIDNLLEKNRTQDFNENDCLLWQHYEFIEHLVRLAKTQALIKLQPSQ